MSLGRRLNALEERTGAGADPEEYVIRLQYVDAAGVIHEEKRICYRPPTVPGGCWGPIYRMEHSEGAGWSWCRRTRAQVP
jgi:hypothetical protein